MLKPEVPAAVQRLNVLLTEVDEDNARKPSALPGWSRAHLLAHIGNFGDAMTRQVTEALEGRQVDMYDGGPPARNAAIESDAAKPVDELTGHVTEALGNLVAAWERVDDWSRPIRHRNGTLADTVLNAWREVDIHAADLDLSYTTDDWSQDFCMHLLAFLRPRVPEGNRLVLQAPGVRWAHGDGDKLTIEGKLTDLTAWMAGRQPRGPLTGDLPELQPWP